MGTSMHQGYRALILGKTPDFGVKNSVGRHAGLDPAAMTSDHMDCIRHDRRVARMPSGGSLARSASVLSLGTQGLPIPPPDRRLGGGYQSTRLKPTLSAVRRRL